MESSNGTDEGILRNWLDSEHDHWVRAFVATLDDAIQQLQSACFDHHLQDLLARGIDEETAGRASLVLYREGLIDLFRFVRASGTLTDEVAWSQLKTEHRSLAARGDTDPAIRQALEDALYAAGQTGAGPHSLYRSLIRALMLFLYQYVADGPPWPGASASDEEKIAWGYAALQAIEEHQVFHQALSAYMQEDGVRPVLDVLLEDAVDAVIAHDANLCELERYDLLLSTGLRWVVGAVERS